MAGKLTCIGHVVNSDIIFSEKVSSIMKLQNEYHLQVSMLIYSLMTSHLWRSKCKYQVFSSLKFPFSPGQITV